MQRLFPDPGPVTAAEQLGGLDFGAMAGEDRPYVVSNFVLTLDGRATIAGRSGPIGSKADTEMLVAVRARVDALMIGAGTMRAERYGRVGDALLVIVSGRLDLPWDAPLFADAASRVLICTTSEAAPPETAAEVEVLRHPDGVDLPGLLAYLRHDRQVRALLCEGGPRIHAQLIEQRLIDELFVTHAPKLAGGSGPTLVTGMADGERGLELAWLLHEERTGELFERYLVAGPRG